MEKKNTALPAVLFIIAGIIVLVGAAQIALYLLPQIEVINSALDNGYEMSEILSYVWGEVVPQSLGYIAAIVGFPTVIAAAGMIYKKLHGISLAMAQAAENPPAAPVAAGEDTDKEPIENFFEK